MPDKANAPQPNRAAIEVKTSFRHSIRFKILLVVCIVLGMIWGVIRLWVEPHLIQRALVRSKEAQLTSAIQLAANVELFMRKARADLEKMVRYPTVRAMKKKGLDDFLSQMTALTSVFDYFFVIDPQGRWVSYPKHPELIGEQIPQQNIAWVQKTVASRRTIFLDVMRSRIGTLVSGFATPIFDPAKKVIGILRGVIVISARSTAEEMISRLSVGERGNVFLVAGNGWLLAHPKLPLDYHNFSTFNYGERLAVQRLRQGKQGVALESIRGEPWVVAYAPVRSTRWGVVVEKPQVEIAEQAVKDANLVSRPFWGGFFLGALLLMLGLNYLLRPLSQLVQSLSSEASPRFTTRAHDEIGVLARQLSHLYQQAIASREALRESENKYRNIVRQSADGIAVADHQGYMLEWNDSLARMTGFSSLHVLGRAFWEIPIKLHSADELGLSDDGATARARLHALFVQGLAEKQNEPSDLEMLLPDGKKMLVQSTVFPIALENGMLVGFILRDITETRRLEAQLRHTEKMVAVGQLAGGIAHDFNNQLSGIIGFAELLQMELTQFPQWVPYVENIIISAQRSADLAAKLLAYARKGKYLSVEVDVNRLIEEIVAILSRTLDKRIEVLTQLNARPAVTRGDPTQLQSALLNLAFNARDAMPEGGQLAFTTDLADLAPADLGQLRMPLKEGRYLHIRVKDTGVGMNDEALERLFEPFFTTKQLGKGTGMGLAAVYGTLRNHQGAISVDSRVDHGSQFDLYLPLASSVTKEHLTEEQRQDKPITTGKGHILLVDDERPVRESTALMLRKTGYTVTTCAEGESAIKQYSTRGTDIDLIILDLSMPNMGGKEVFHTIHAINADARVLLSSGFSLDGEASTLLCEGAVGFIQKPYNMAELTQKITNILGSAP
jgi:PAS domain S-box-containing protein